MSALKMCQHGELNWLSMQPTQWAFPVAVSPASSSFPCVGPEGARSSLKSVGGMRLDQTGVGMRSGSEVCVCANLSC